MHGAADRVGLHSLRRPLPLDRVCRSGGGVAEVTDGLAGRFPAWLPGPGALPRARARLPDRRLQDQGVQPGVGDGLALCRPAHRPDRTRAGLVDGQVDPVPPVPLRHRLLGWAPGLPDAPGRRLQVGHPRRVHHHGGAPDRVRRGPVPQARSGLLRRAPVRQPDRIAGHRHRLRGDQPAAPAGGRAEPADQPHRRGRRRLLPVRDHRRHHVLRDLGTAAPGAPPPCRGPEAGGPARPHPRRSRDLLRLARVRLPCLSAVPGQPGDRRDRGRGRGLDPERPGVRPAHPPERKDPGG